MLNKQTLNKTNSLVRNTLIFSTTLALFAALVVLIVSHWQFDLASIVFGLVFILSIVTVAMCCLGAKENDETFGQGSGTNKKV